MVTMMGSIDSTSVSSIDVTDCVMLEAPLGIVTVPLKVT